ncbi:MAG: TonB family protein [Thermoanaerobaculia bacterium]|nr:TonB family protein [Thermoanaerobaculia bacterium]
MSLILVVESEGRHAERVRDGLGSDGWQVEVVASCEAAVAAVADRAPQLVLINAELPGAPEMLRSLSRAHGGPGSIALLPEIVGKDLGPLDADESLIKPFSEKDLRQLARRVVSSARAPRKSEAEADQKRLTSHELFGDLLAEVESEVAAARPAAPEPSRPPATAPAPAPVVAAPAPAPASGRSLEMEQRLERTLSGMIKDERAAAPTPKKASTKIDDMLTATLSGLDMPKKTKPAATSAAGSSASAAGAPSAALAQPTAATAPRPPAEPPIPAMPVAPAAAPAVPVPAPISAATAAIPIVAAAPAPPPVAPPAAKPPAPAPTPAPAVATTAAVKPAEPTTAVRRQSREIDLAQLDQLAKPRAKESTPAARPAAPKETFATQKISIQPSFLQPPSSEFGQYTLLERIAVGGMAEVWKARMKGVEGFQKTVAIKKILPHLTDSSDFVTMFIDEAKLAAQLNHNNIIHIYDLGKIGEDYFIAMEFVDGKDLRSILNSARAESRPLPLGLALLVGSRLASALDHAHRQKDFEGRPLGLVHRDVSPQNVLISYEGDIKLCDFGIVKAVTKASKTQMGALKGKLQYMSPEQAWGRPVDARSDIFSLGSLLFEMLTGRRLFSGESEMSVLDAVREGRIQAPRDLDPRLPLEVNALVLKALARDPDDRFLTAGEMQREIDGILASLKPAPSQSDLGTYLHQLFAAEAQAGAAPAASAAAPAAARGAASTASAAVPARQPEVAVVAPTGVSKIEDADSGRSGKLLWMAIGGVAAAGLIAYLLLGRGTPAAPPAAPAPTAVESPAAPASEVGASAGATDAGQPSAEAAGASPATVSPAAPVAGQNVDQMVSDEVKRREEELKKKYEDELARRKAELDKLNTKPATATAPAAAPPVTAAPPPTQEAPPAPAPVADPVIETPPAAAAPQPVVETPPAAAAPQGPEVKEGDLVRPGAGVKPPVLVSLTKPEYPAMARRMKVEGTVVVSLLVDETGRVAETRLDSGVSQKVGINEAALAAARSAVFSPATKSGVRVKMWYQLKIPFKL